MNMQDSSAVLLGLIGLIGSIVALLGIVVKFFVSELKESRRDHKELTNKFVHVAEEGAETRIHLKQSIDANTNATRQSTDKLSKLILSIIKTR